MSDHRDPARPMTGQEQVNLVSDTVAGPNLRWRDNLFQGLAIVAAVGLGVLVGWLAVADQPMGMILGGFAGLVVGLLGSGIFLMIFRALRHAKGKHD